jgi:GGDEF domain-containing protein
MLPAEWLDIPVTKIRRKLVMALLLGEVFPLLVVVYLVLALVWPGTVAGKPGWNALVIILLSSVVVLMAAGAAVVMSVAGRVTALAETLRGVNLPEKTSPDDDELAALSQRLNLLLRQRQERDLECERLEVDLRNAREKAAKLARAYEEGPTGPSFPYVGKALFDLLIGLEVARAIRHHRTFSLAAVCFAPADKSVPEDVAARARAWVADYLPAHVREVDVAYQSAPGEVLFLLPETHERQSMRFAQRISSRIESHPHVTNDRVAGVRMKAGCGVATFPTDATEAGQLVAIVSTRLDAARSGDATVVGRT